ncbi:hypothetical protein [Kitasatospora sp. NPDC056531]|uniref:hypothetical protein n=1 Tax=Kitasatospora sp. NPDC056531 TaxID=3345856 RepID=UPI0036C2F6DA
MNINLWLMDEFSMNAVFGAGAKSESRLDFGADVQGWVEQGGVDVEFRCDNPENTRLGTPYVGIQVWTSIDRQSDTTHRAVLGIALKYAKAVVAEFPCSNPVRLPESVPESAGNFPPPGP